MQKDQTQVPLKANKLVGATKVTEPTKFKEVEIEIIECLFDLIRLIKAKNDTVNATANKLIWLSLAQEVSNPLDVHHIMDFSLQLTAQLTARFGDITRENKELETKLDEINSCLDENEEKGELRQHQAAYLKLLLESAGVDITSSNINRDVNKVTLNEEILVGPILPVIFRLLSKEQEPYLEDYLQVLQALKSIIQDDYLLDKEKAKGFLGLGVKGKKDGVACTENISMGLVKLIQSTTMSSKSPLIEAFLTELSFHLERSRIPLPGLDKLGLSFTVNPPKSKDAKQTQAELHPVTLDTQLFVCVDWGNLKHKFSFEVVLNDGEAPQQVTLCRKGSSNTDLGVIVTSLLEKNTNLHKSLNIILRPFTCDTMCRTALHKILSDLCVPALKAAVNIQMKKRSSVSDLDSSTKQSM